MLAVCQKPEVGAVGVKIFDKKSERVYHAGIDSGSKKYRFSGLPREQSGYFHQDNLMQYVSAVTSDFMMLASDDYNQLLHQHVEYLRDEVEICNYIRDSGKKVIYNPNIQAYIRKM